MATDAIQAFRSLGLVPRSLFAPSVQETENNAKHLILLDGVGASFALTLNEQVSVEDDRRYYDWAWSSDVPHHVEFAGDEQKGVALVRRWDSPGTVKRFQLASVMQHGAEFLAQLERAGRPSKRSVVRHVLDLFRVLRDSLNIRADERAAGVRVFHELLEAAAVLAQRDDEERTNWAAALTLRAAVTKAENSVVPESLLDRRIPRGLLEAFLQPEPSTGRVLDARLLLRHAAGALYQEAHLELVRADFEQQQLFAHRSTKTKTRTIRRDVVYTPTGLARYLADATWGALVRGLSDNPGQEITVLDPACGSGVFLAQFPYLIEGSAWRAPKVNLLGFDESDAATTLAHIATRDAIAEAGATAASTVDIRTVDALTVDWPEVDAVVMNPPFVAWEDLGDRRDRVLEVCGGDQNGRPDLAMAFVALALRALKPGGVLATVIPSSLLETKSGQPWREKILDVAEPTTIGRFRGNDIFPMAMVEPAIVLLRKRRQGDAPGLTLMVLSEPGGADAAIRALRRGATSGTSKEGFESYVVPAPELGTVSWLPRPQSLRNIVSEIERSEPLRVRDLFDVRQGIRTGANQVFVLSADAWGRLPARERKLFRPLAGSRSIENATLQRSQYVFYPYAYGRSAFEEEDEVREAVPRYFERYLLPNKDLLRRRAQMQSHWWELMRPRTWQFEPHAKLVSTYFAVAGQFALDREGGFVVGQGYGWFPNDNAVELAREASDEIGDRDDEAELLTPDELTLQVGPCYLAVFNSKRFEQLLSYFAPRVMGGQFDVSPRFVDPIPIPDFFSGTAVGYEVTEALREAGDALTRGEHWPLPERVEDLVAEAYGISPARWPIAL